MPDILIITPEPETRKILELAFGLAGANVKSEVSTNFLSKGKARADAVIVDLIGEDPSRWQDYFSALKKAASLKGTKTVALLPRNHLNTKVSKNLDGIDLIVKRPFELFDVVEKITELTKSEPIKPQKKLPPKKRKQPR